MSGKGVVESIFVLDAVRDFYISAFDHALVVVGVVFGVVGVIVPVGISFFQQRQARAEVDLIRGEVATEVAVNLSREMSRLREDNETALANLMNDLRDELDKFKVDAEKQINGAKGGLLLIQAKQARATGEFAVALHSAAVAAIKFNEVSEFSNFNAAFNVAVSCIENLGGSSSHSEFRAISKYKDMMEVLRGGGRNDFEYRLFKAEATLARMEKEWAGVASGGDDEEG